MNGLGIILLALHGLADFPLQTDWMAANKGGGSKAHLAHVGVHFALYATVLGGLFGTSGLLPAMFVAGWHSVIDWRRWAEPKPGFELYPIAVDQSLHVSSIALAVIIW